MNLTSVLITTLLVLLVMGFMSFGYLTNTIHKDAKQQIGKLHVSDHQLLFYIHLTIHVLTFAVGVGLFFKAKTY